MTFLFNNLPTWLILQSYYV